MCRPILTLLPKGQIGFQPYLIIVDTKFVNPSRIFLHLQQRQSNIHITIVKHILPFFNGLLDFALSVEGSILARELGI